MENNNRYDRISHQNIFDKALSIWVTEYDAKFNDFEKNYSSNIEEILKKKAEVGEKKETIATCGRISKNIENIEISTSKNENELQKIKSAIAKIKSSSSKFDKLCKEKEEKDIQVRIVQDKIKTILSSDVVSNLNEIHRKMPYYVKNYMRKDFEDVQKEFKKINNKLKEIGFYCSVLEDIYLINWNRKDRIKSYLDQKISMENLLLNTHKIEED
ncbi:hypothetical protein [Gluconobacter cerinus]|uniref:hypothetical protein n=1 Tax=Gluconobacter cerinus TaxID=38307 RepID=UPI001B8CE234|nr:hypothetical protein [Gluconobacter cerinus]MBS1038086.1 hypothetical protein [Gluconobacter cerinus]